MRNEVIKELTENFENHSQITESGIEFWFARDIKGRFGYKEWRNFDGVIKRAIHLINFTCCDGVIKKTRRNVTIGSGAIREINDYLLDHDGLELIKKLSSSQKLNNIFSIRNESVVLQLIEKYCREKAIFFSFQYFLEEYRFDCIVGENILIEFDEPHHIWNTKQKIIDAKKEKIALLNGCKIFRIDLNMDIVDIILYIEKNA